MARIVYFGNEQLAQGIKPQTPIFDALIEHGYEIAALILPTANTRKPFPIALKAQAHNIPIYYTKDNAEILDIVTKTKADIGVLAAFSKFIGKSIIDAFPYGIINVHPSMLPKYRGGNPYSRVIMNGETETGVTIHFMDERFDTGDIIAQKPYHIHSKATMGTLFNELNVIGIELLLQVLQAYEVQELPRIKQPQGDFISGRGLSERDIFINYNRTAEEIERFIRALNPFILASTIFRGNLMKIMKAEVASDAFCIPHPAGTVAKIEDDKFFIATSKGLIAPTVLQFGSFFIGDSKDFIRIVNPKIGEEFK